MTTGSDAVGVRVTGDTADVTAALDKVGFAAERMAARAAKAAAQAKVDNDRFTASIQRQIDTFGLTGTALMKYEAGVRGIGAAVDPLINKLQALKDAQAAAAKQAGTVASGAGFTEMAEGADKAAHSTAGINRELIVLAHELSQGNFKRFGGSLLVLAEYGSAATAAIAGIVTNPITLAIAALAALGLAAHAGAAEQKELQDALKLTGNYAGMTEGQFDSMAKRIATSSQTGIGGVRTVLAELAKTGDIGPGLFGAAAAAVVGMEKLTGESADKIVADFAKMSDGVAKWALEHNRQYNFITTAQYEHIKTLEQEGSREDAMAAVYDALNQKLAQQTTNLGYLATAWKFLGTTAANAWDAMKGVGKEATVEDLIEAQRKKLEAMRTLAPANRPLIAAANPLAPSEATPGSEASDMAGSDLRMLGNIQSAKELDTALKAQAEAHAKAGMAASDYFDKIDKERKGVTQLTKDLAELDRNIAARVADGGPAHTPEDDKRRAYIMEHDKPKKTDADKSQTQLDTAYKTTLDSLTAEGIRLQAEVENWTRYGKALDTSRLAVVNFDIAQGKLKGKNGATLTEPEKAALRSQATKDDGLAKNKLDAESAAKADNAFQKYITTLRDVAEAKSMNARDSEIAAGLAKMEAEGIKVGSEAYIENAASIRTWVGFKHDAMLASKQAAEARANEDEIHKLDEEAAALGKSSVERAKASAVLKLYSEAKKDVAANPLKQDDIWSKEASEADKLTAAIQRNYDAKRTSEAGSKTFFSQYAEDATNAAKVTESLASTGVKSLEDGLTGLLSGQKVNFKSLVDSFLAETTRLTVVKPLLADIFGTTGTNGTGSQGIGAVIGSITQKLFGLGGAKPAADTTAGGTTEGSVGDAAFASASKAVDTTAQSSAVTTSTLKFTDLSDATTLQTSSLRDATSALEQFTTATLGAARPMGVSASPMTFDTSAGAANDSSGAEQAVIAQTAATTASASAIAGQTSAISNSSSALVAQTARIASSTGVFGQLGGTMLNLIATLSSLSGASAVGSSGGLLGSFAGLFGGGKSAAGAAAGAGESSSIATEAMTLFSAATGENNVPYDGAMYMLHKGEAVIPAAYNPAAGGKAANDGSASGGPGNIVFNNTYHVGSGVPMQQVAAMVQAGQNQTKADILTSMQRSGQYAQR